MKEIIPPFQGFHKNSFKFLSDLKRNNNTLWFNKHKSRFQEELVLPARSFVVDMAQFFNRLNPSIRTGPKFNETLMRINKDMRFTKGEPYRNYFLIHFGRYKMDSEFYVYFEPDNFQYGLFINNSGENKEFIFKQNFEKYKNQFLKILDDYNINHNFELYDMKKEIILITKSFNGKEHADNLPGTKMILLQKSVSPDNKIIYSSEVMIDIIKTFSLLYPIYCFAVFSEPLKMITEFEENFGVLDSSLSI